jgi:hypothetical protein
MQHGAPIGTFIMRCLRRVLAVALAMLIVACVFHQAFQFAARFLPSTQGAATDAGNELAEYTVASVHGRGFRVPATRLCVLSDGYRYKVDGVMHEVRRIHIEMPVDREGCEIPPPLLVEVHYVPWAPGWAAPAPSLSPILWLFLFAVGLPLLAFLAMPGKVARSTVDFLGKLPRPDRA